MESTAAERSLSREDMAFVEEEADIVKLRADLNLAIQASIERVRAQRPKVKVSISEITDRIAAAYTSEDRLEKELYHRAMDRGFTSAPEDISPTHMPPLMYLAASGMVRRVDDESLGVLIDLTDPAVYTAGAYWQSTIVKGFSRHAAALRVLFARTVGETEARRGDMVDPRVLFQMATWNSDPNGSYLRAAIEEALKSQRNARAFTGAFREIMERSPKLIATSGILPFLVRRFADAYASSYADEPRTLGNTFTKSSAEAYAISREEIKDWLTEVAQVAVGYRNRYLEAVKVGRSPTTIPRLSAVSSPTYLDQRIAFSTTPPRPILFDAARFGSRDLFRYLLTEALTEEEWRKNYAAMEGISLDVYLERLIVVTRQAMERKKRKTPSHLVALYEGMRLYLAEKEANSE